jgi:hypothetical protein
MTYSTEFATMDCLEFCRLDQLRGHHRAAFKQLCADYEAEFKPRNKLERDVVKRLATLRWSIDRVRACETLTRKAFDAHGFQTRKMKDALEELSGYLRHLTERYDHYFTAVQRLRQSAEVA